MAQRRIPADFIRSQSTQHLKQEAVRAVAKGYSTIVALGGDGTFHHLVEATCSADVVLGFFPAGNGNDIAEGLGIARDPLAAAEQFLRAKPRAVDLLEARFDDGHCAHYIGAGGTGLDAESARLANTRFRRLPGVIRYVAGALSTLAGYDALELEADMDSRVWSGRVVLAAIANAPCYGAGFRIAPDAKMDDGWLDITLVREMPWTRLVEAIPTVLETEHWKWEGVERFRARSVKLRASRASPFQGDGELLGDLPVEIRVLPAALRVRAPMRS